MASSTAQKTQELRTVLKAQGWTSKHISVRGERYSMGSTIHVVIRVAGISKSLVAAIARAFEDVRRDEWGEILCGGNRFVDVRFDEFAHLAEQAALMPEVEQSMAVAQDAEQDGRYTIIPVHGTPYLIRSERHAFQVYGPCDVRDPQGPKQPLQTRGDAVSLARYLAELADA